jgi:hypothetical protein
MSEIYYLISKKSARCICFNLIRIGLNLALEKGYILVNNKMDKEMDKAYPKKDNFNIARPTSFIALFVFLSRAGFCFKGCIYPLDKIYTIEYNIK